MKPKTDNTHTDKIRILLFMICSARFSLHGLASTFYLHSIITALRTQGHHSVFMRRFAHFTIDSISHGNPPHADEPPERSHESGKKKIGRSVHA